MGLFSKSKSLIGLDVGSSAIKAVELKEQKGGSFGLVHLGLEEIPTEAIVDGTILDSALVIESIQTLMTKNRIKTTDVATAVSGNAVIVKKIQLPTMSDEELAESIQWEAEQYIPFDIGDVSIDYQVMGHSATEEKNMDVLLVAVKRDKINDYTSVITQAGRSPVIMDVDSFALQNCYEVNYGFTSGEVVALINIGASIINITMINDGSSIFWRDVSIGGNQYTDSIMKELNLSFDQADQLKRGYQVEGVSMDQAQPVIEQVSQDIATETQKTFDFFIATSSSDHIDRIALAGGCSKVANLDSIMSDKFSVPVELIDPFKNIEFNPKDFDPEDLRDIAPSFAVAVGLALRKVGDS
ncbi:type IV pilus assembly protein PilM [Acidobacteriota bacterium]